jgi:hypothetical protein
MKFQVSFLEIARKFQVNRKEISTHFLETTKNPNSPLGVAKSPLMGTGHFPWAWLLKINILKILKSINIY